MSARDYNSAYRKGVVLGLTMAEIMILFIFLLLLSLSLMLTKEKRTNALIHEKEAILRSLIKVIDNKDPEITEELTRTVVKLPEMLTSIKKDSLSDDKETMDQVLTRGIEKLKAEKLAAANRNDLPIEKQLSAALEKQAELQSEIENVRDQNLSLIKKNESQGKGGDLPPCWSKNGKAEYIYNVTLENVGIIVHDNKLPDRVFEQSKLPISAIVLDTPMSMSSFSQQTLPLLNWSNEKLCRFYVRIYDRTDGDKKDLYKRLRDTVEGTFYKKDVRN